MARKTSLAAQSPRQDQFDPLMVQSVEKAFTVLSAFDAAHPSMSLTQVMSTTGFNKSAAQRFTHTLVQLGYLHKDPETKRFELTTKTLDFGYHYTRSSRLVQQALPYLLHLSKTTEETINLTVHDDTEIVFVSRFLSRHMLNTDVTVGSRMPAFCMAPGIAILSRLPRDEALDILRRSDRRPYTQQTVWQLNALTDRLDQAAARGYATAFEEYYHGDLSIAAAILDTRGRPTAAINIAVSSARFTPEEAEKKLSALVVAAALSISRNITLPR